jgi:hypothetical protein
MLIRKEFAAGISSSLPNWAASQMRSAPMACTGGWLRQLV